MFWNLKLLVIYKKIFQFSLLQNWHMFIVSKNHVHYVIEPSASYDVIMILIYYICIEMYISSYDEWKLMKTCTKWITPTPLCIQFIMAQ